MKKHAIFFDLDTECVKENYHNESYTNVYANIKTFMTDKGFLWAQGSVYFSSEEIGTNECYAYILELANKYEWFYTCVKDVRLLEIGEENDLLKFLKLVKK